MPTGRDPSHTCRGRHWSRLWAWLSPLSRRSVWRLGSCLPLSLCRLQSLSLKSVSAQGPSALWICTVLRRLWTGYGSMSLPMEHSLPHASCSWTMLTALARSSTSDSLPALPHHALTQTWQCRFSAVLSKLSGSRRKIKASLGFAPPSECLLPWPALPPGEV